MLSLPNAMRAVLAPFAPVFRKRVWEYAKLLVVGAILVPGQRTVASVLRVMGRGKDRHFQNDHRVLNRDRWASRIVSTILLRLLVDAFVPPEAPVIVGIDEHIERRRGAKIAAKGIYRDPVRSSKEFFVKTSGTPRVPRWISMQLLASIPWAQRVWALPFLTVLAPSERDHPQRGRRHKTITDWGRPMILQLRRWLPDRALVVVADSAYAVLDLLARCQRLPRPVSVVTRLRLDAALSDLPPERAPRTRGRPRRKGKRQPTLQAGLSDPQTNWQLLRVRWYGEPSGRLRSPPERLCGITAECRPWGALWAPVGGDAGSGRQVRSPGIALHGSGCCSSADHRMVCPALATRSHLSFGV